MIRGGVVYLCSSPNQPLASAVIKTLEDLDARAKKQAKLEHTVKWGFVGVLLSWLGNFGLVWAV